MGLESEIKNSDFSQKQLRYLRNLISRIKIGFDNLTNEQGRQIANLLGNLTGFAIRKYGYNLNGISIPTLINGIENFNLNDTNQSEVKFYPNSQAPLTITCKENFAPNLNNGEYIRVYTQIDNNSNVDRIFKTIPAGTLFGVYNTAAYFQCSKENFGNDLQVGTPYNVEVVNNTTKLPKLKMFSQYYVEFLSSITGSTITTQQWLMWDYLYSYWSIDMTNETQGIKLDLFHKETNSLVGTGYAYPGGNYSGDNWMGQFSTGYGTNNFKIVISNI